MKLLAVVGMSGAGKSVITDYLEDNKWKKIYFGGITYKLMKEAGDKLKIELEKTNIKEPTFPVIANFSASNILEPEKIRESLYFQSFSKVRFTESINNILRDYAPTNFKEFGNGAVLSGLIRKINRDIKSL